MKEHERETPNPSLRLDPDKYRAHLKEMELNTEQENELLHILWNIMTAMVDIGFGDHSVQTVMDSLVKDASSESPDTLQKKCNPIKANQTAFDNIANKESHYE